MKKQKTTYKSDNDVREWHLIDAKDLILGRLSTNIVKLLSGKNKFTYNPAVDNGDFVVVTNINQIKLTGDKHNQKIYYSHSGYPGGLKETPFLRLLDKNPEKIIFSAVKGMLPKNRLAPKMMKRLKLYSGSDHPHEAQLKVKSTAEETKNVQ